MKIIVIVSHIILVLLTIILIGDVNAASIEAFPAMLCIQNLQPGSSFNLEEESNFAITIPNQSNTRYLYKVVLKEVANILGGYQRLPNDFIKFVPDSVIVEPWDTGRVNVIVTIPEGDEYYNKNYEAPIQIRKFPVSKKGAPMGVSFQLNVTVDYFFETVNNRDVSNFQGEFEVIPNVALVTDYVLGSDVIQNITIFNNDNKKHTYTLNTYAPEMQDTISIVRDILVSIPGHWIIEDNWVQPETKKFLFLFDKGKNITVGPKDKKEYRIDINVPSDAKLPESVLMPGNIYYVPTFWESIIMVESDTGQKDFVRIKVFPSAN
ncbi:hypothetical protein JXI42_06080 [bacterium]|nr:hypothetical protein [bacterium]